MPNSFFRFKQFIVHQDRCAMKVCTDSCMLGAWTALRAGRAIRILDIGAGTGLLSLMIAQKTKAQITAVEWDKDSYGQAKENIQQSHWAGKIQIHNGDVREYNYPGKYDFIVVNPPFYESDLHSPQPKNNQAKHEVSLSLGELISVIESNLAMDGMFSILIPEHRSAYFEGLAFNSGFFLQEQVIVRQTPVHSAFRSIGLYARTKTAKKQLSEITIKNGEGNYSEPFRELMNDYYG